MRIGIFGNTNNYPLLLAEALRSLGHEVVLVVDSPEPLHRPESRRSEWAGSYPEWIVDGGGLSEWDYIDPGPRIAPLLEAQSGTEALILNSLGPSLLPFLDLPAIAFLTGSDLTHYASPDVLAARTAGWSRQFRDSAEGRIQLFALRDLVERQRYGIRAAAAVSYLPRGVAADGDRLLEGLGVGEDERLSLLMAEVDRLGYSLPSTREALRVFSATRFTWHGPLEPGRSTLDYKGSDVMIRGLGAFRRGGGALAEVRLVRKGLHLEEAERLVAAEGLADVVTWLPEMPLTAVWEEFERSDVVVEQLGGSMVGMAGMDAMVIGRPVIANGRPDIFGSLLGEPLPVCHATTPEQVHDWLRRLTSPAERERIGAAAHRYATDHFDPRRAARECVDRLESALRRGGYRRQVRRLEMRGALVAAVAEAERRAESGGLRERARRSLRMALGHVLSRARKGATPEE